MYLIINFANFILSKSLDLVCKKNKTHRFDEFYNFLREKSKIWLSEIR